MDRNIPLKLRIAQCFCDGQAHGLDELYAVLGPEYGHERQFSRKQLENHLKALRVVGILRDDEVILDGEQRLMVSYRISEFGRAKVQRAL